MSKHINLTTPGWLGSYEEMAAYAGCSKRSISRWINEGDLKVRRLSSRKVICLPKDIDRCLIAISDRYEMEGASR
jgi:predicted site-specific integrase-resolvase